MKRYNPKELEPKWQKKWADDKLYKAIDFDESRPKYVMLTEFPYPSGDGLHIGHVREYTLGDIVARHKRMTGHNVLYPMGYDAFGLPTENYAIKHKIAPEKATAQNVGNFQKQFDSLGYSIDWDRSFSTTDPDYYKWTQWLFLQFFKAGLAYQDEIDINWCPKCKTGLANEEVINGLHERCDTPVEKKQLKQWLLKITKYADRLIDGLETVDYPSRISDQQINWIGKSQGAEITFDVKDSTGSIKVFTTRPDTLFGATFMVLAPEHDLVKKITTPEQKADVEAYVKQAETKSEIDRQDEKREKTGVFTGAYAINPVNNEPIPVWIADYVLGNYGTGAIMAVPAHDQRDFEFAKKFDLPIKQVILSLENDSQNPPQKGFEEVEYETALSGEGVLVNSGKYDGMKSSLAREKITTDLKKQGQAEFKNTYRLRDWIFSRQHYWGEPIPIIHCQKDGTVAVPDEDLPVELPKTDNYEPTETGESPLASITDWVNTTCPKCGGKARRETDTMPNWAGSSWYYLRYYDAHNNKAFADKKKLEYWGEVDMYLGGMEHTTLHLLYSRFWHQFFYDQGLVPTPEPYAARRGQGIILAEDGSKMSKSKGNVINPNEVIKAGYGADALRMAIAFLAPYDQTTPWNPEGVAGTHRFISRVWTLTQEFLTQTKTVTEGSNKQLLTVQHQTIARVSRDLHQMSFNTVVSALMEYVNVLYKIKAEDTFAAKEWPEAIRVLLQLLAPFAPHIAEELWQQIGQSSSVHVSTWPVHDEKYLVQDTVTIVVQVNGKVRANIDLPANSSEQAVLTVVQADKKLHGHLDGKSINKTIYVPDKLINLVVG